MKKRLQRRGFPVKFAKFLKTPFFTEHLQWLLLKNGLERKYEISPVYMTKVAGLQRKTSEKERLPAVTTKVHKLNHKRNLEWLKICSENFRMAVSRKMSVY